MDQQNKGWTPDPDAIPELANISFDRLRDVNFRWYVRGWMQNPLCDQAYAPYPTYDESQIPNDYKFAYLKGKTDDRFNPVEYVKDDDSIEKYGEHWGAVDNNDDIYPTIQGRSRSGLGRIDAVVDVSEIVTDDIEGASKAVSEVTNIGGVKSMSTSIASGQTVSKSFTGETFAVKAGMTGVITAMPFKKFGKNETQDAMVTMSLTVQVINASTGQVATTASGETITTGSIPTGTYYLRVTALLENHSMTDDLEGTFGLNEVKLQSDGYDTEEWKPTFDIWVKNIWGTTQGSGETDLAYTERVWLPILGDRAGNEAKVVFSDGFMSVSSDYEFVIAAYPVPDRTKTILVDGVEVQSEWKITLRKSDAEFEATGLYIPNSTTGGKPVAGDHFFFIGIDMPFDYVLWGEEDLNTYKAAQLDKTAQVNPTWVINLDKVRVHTLEQGEYDTVLADRLAAGATVHIKDKRFTGGDVLTLYVQSMTYTWNEPTDDNPYIVPDIEVVLSDKVVSRTSVVEQIQGDVDVIRTQYAKIDDIEGVVRRVASPLFLKKTGESDKSLSPTQFAGKVSSDDFRQGDVGGAGWGAYTDGDGNAVYEVDKLVVRKELRVNNLVANQISYVGGKQINSAASIECVQVREESDGYVCYFDQKRGSIANLFVVGDYAMGQIFNPNDVEERYYRRRVNEVGENYIKLSKATGQVDGSGVPQVGDIIVQYGHESNTARQYAIVRDVIGGGYESMLMGLNSASAAGTEYYMSGRKSSLTGPRWFVGDTAGQHAEYYNGVLNITGRLSVSSQIEKSSGVYVGLSQYLNSLQDQIDGNIQSWAGDDDPLPVEVEGSVDPSTANYPASAWTTDTDRLKHMGDIYVNNTTGQGWRYTRQANDGDFYWMRITDEELANALQRISALETSVEGLAYLKAATNQGTLVEGGLVLTSLIQLGQTVNNVFTVWAGINGILDQTLANPLKSIAAWYGGPMRDLEMEGSGSGSGSGVSYAKSLFRMDGSGYLAGGNITWDNVGAGSIPGVHWDGNSVTIDGNVKLASTSGDSVTELLALVQELSSFFQKVNIGTAANPVYAVKVRDEYAGLYSPGFLTAGGVGSGSGGGGGEIDLDRVWESLTNNVDFPDTKINTAHIPDMASIYGYLKGNQTITLTGVVTGTGTTSISTSIADGALSIAKVSGLQTALNAKQDIISDLETIRSNAQNGNVAYGWGNHANAGYLTSSDGAIISDCLKSLQSQIDSVASRDNFDELVVTSLFSDVASISSLYAETIYLGGTSVASSLSSLSTAISNEATARANADSGLSTAISNEATARANADSALSTAIDGVASRTTTLEGYFDANGNAKSALKLTTVSKTIWGQAYWTSGGVPQNVTAAPNLYIGGSKVQTSQVAQALVGISSISAVVSPESDDETRIEWDATNHAWHFHGGIYADTFVVAGGVGSGGGGGSDIDLDRVWESLTNNTDFPDVKINLAHIPNIPWANILNTPTTLAGYGITDAKFGTDGADYVPITLGATTKNVLTAHQSLAGYATESWVGQQGFITKAVNDLTNYYLKSETYTQAEVNALIGAINQFRYEIAASTSAVTDPQSNVLYLIGPTGSGPDKYEEYVYANNTWTKIGDTSIDLTPYLTITAAAQTYQPIISDLATIRNNATHGETAYSDLATVSELLQSLQSQVDSVASRDCFDELTASVFYSDIAAVSDLYVGTVSLNGVDLAGSLSSLASRATSLESRATALEGRATSLESRATTLESYFTNGVANSALRLSGTATYSIWGVEYWSSGVPKSVTGRPGLYIGTTQVQTSAASQDLNGIAAINASGLATIAGGIKLTTTKKIYFGDTDHYLELDSNGFHFSHGVYSEDFVTAGGIGSGGSGGGGIVDTIHRYADLGGTFSDSDNDVFNAYTVNKINTDLSARILQLEGGSATSITTTGSGNVVTGVSKAGTVITVTKGTTLGSLATLSSITTSYVTDLESWIAGKGYVTSSGVTSVGLSVPTGLSVSGSPVTTSGTLAITFASGYSIPTTAQQSAWSGKQDAISDLTTIRNNAANGATAYGWGNHASAGYLTSANGTTISDCLKSLQSQIDSVASRDMFDELSATVLHSDIVTASNAYFEAITGSLSGNATTASYLVGSAYGVGSGLNPIYFSGGRPVASTATAGSAAVPVFLNGGTLTAITPSSLFSALSSSAATNLSMTIAGQGRTIADLYARYDKDGGEIAPNMTTIGTALRSLQSQVDSVASRDRFDELNATVLFTDVLSVGGDTHVGGKIWFDSTHYIEIINGYLHTNLPIVSDSYIVAGA